jgi:hypothetical protein
MQQQHKSLLVSTYTTVLQHLSEIRQVVAEGKTPGGARVMPLPDSLRQRLLANLDSVALWLGNLIQEFVPEWQQSDRERGGPAATRMWVNILLRTIEELVEGIMPGRMSRKYGAIGAAEAERLQDNVESVLSALREAMLVMSAEAGGERPRR